MPRQKSDNPRAIVFCIRLARNEYDELCKRAGAVPLGQWIRQRALSSLEMRCSSVPPAAQSEGLPDTTVEGGEEFQSHGLAKVTRIISVDLISGPSQG